MKSIMTKTIACLLALTVSLSAVSCKPQDTPKLSSENVTVWGASANEKILQDLPASSYESIKTDAKIDIFMARGEYESGQVIITPSVDVKEYNVTVSKLKHVSGNAEIPTENMQVRMAKYISVTLNTSKNGAPLGMYPDALVPFSAVVEYEENKIIANENQSIYLTVETQLDQPAGIYTGTLTIDFKDFVKSVPVSVNVMNVTVSEEAHAKNCYLATWNSVNGELDTTQGMRDRYYDALIEYRLSPSLILKENDQSDEMIKAYVDKAYTYLINPRCSNIGIPYAEATGDYNGKSYKCISGKLFEKYLTAFMNKSLETGVNLMRKLVFYNAVIDEAFLMNRPMDQVRLNYKIMNETILKVASEFEGKTVQKQQFKQEIIESLKVLPCILTCEYSQNYIDGCADEIEYINTYCPLYQHYDSESQRENYKREEIVEQWWYGCNTPRDPYPSTHTDVTDTLSLRVIGWMQQEYGIVGNLNWAVDYYITHGDENRDTFLEDYFSGNADRTKTEGNGAANGDGYLFYPGGQYGLDKPIASIRLEGLRDGMEDYEVIYALKEKYKELGFSADKLLSVLGENLFSGAQVTADNKKYEDARYNLYSLASAANSSANVCIVETNDNANGIIESKIYAKDGVEIKSNGQVLSNGVKHGDGVIYTVITTLNKDVNALDLSYVIDGVETSYYQNFGGKVDYYDANALNGAFVSDFANVEQSLESENPFGLDKSMLKLTVGEIADDTGLKQQRFKLQSNAFESFDAKVGKFTIVLYNAESTAITLNMYAKYTKDPAPALIATVILKPNEKTTITVSVDAINWKTKGKLSYLNLKLNESSFESAKILYVESLAVYYK